MLIELDGRGPRYAQITRALIAAIDTGALAPGARLPATRNLAKQLGRARNVVLLAYERLLLEGYITGKPRVGTFVSTTLPRLASPTQRQPSRTRGRLDLLTPAGRRLVEESERARAITRSTRTFGIDFTARVAEPDALFVSHLKRAFGKALSQPSVFGYGDPAGDEGLRSEIARRLRGLRGIARTAEHIVVTSGARQAVDICARLLVRRGDRVLMEDPGYEPARAAFRAAGATIVPVSVGPHGLDASTLPDTMPRARLVYVTPAHQFPTGTLLTVADRHRLLAFARAQGAYVLEDDYDGALRHGPPLVKALAGFQPDANVIYCGSFAKSLFASLRLGYLALPATLVGAVVSAKWLSDRASSNLLQRLVRDIMTTGEYDRHIRRMQRRYAARRDVLRTALTQYLGSEVEVAGDGAGMHLVAWFARLAPSEMDALVTACRRRDVGVSSIASHAVRPMARGGLILGYGMVDEEAIAVGVRRLAAAYRSVEHARRL